MPDEAQLRRVVVNGLVGYINQQGEVVIECQFEHGTDFFGGLAAVGLRDESGFIDASGTMRIRHDYADVGRFAEGLCAVTVGKGWPHYSGFIDTTGRLVVDAKFDLARSFSSGVASVKMEGKWGLIEKTGRFAAACKYDQCWSMVAGESVIGFKRSGKWGLLSKEGKELLAPRFDYAYACSHGLIGVQTKGKWGFINTDGEFRIPGMYEKINPHYVEGFVGVRKLGKWGIIDTSGAPVTGFDYTYVNDFSEGLAGVYVGGQWDHDTYVCGGKWGFINSDGELVIQPRYDHVHDFRSGICRVDVGDVQNRDYAVGYINRCGE
jgi:hypothetical protein